MNNDFQSNNEFYLEWLLDNEYEDSEERYDYWLENYCPDCGFSTCYGSCGCDHEFRY